MNETGSLDLSILHGGGTNFTAKLSSGFKGYSGHKHQKDNKILVKKDNADNIIASMPFNNVNQLDMVFLTDVLKDFKTTCTQNGLQLPERAVLNLNTFFPCVRTEKWFGIKG